LVDQVETASFRADDAPCYVEASLACRRCLSGEVDWSLDVEDFEAEVKVSCRACGYHRTVSLTGDQALRLALEDRRS
jgi:hypothetical protein